MSGKAFNIIPAFVMLAAAGGLVALAIQFRTTDLAAMAATTTSEPVAIPTFPPATQADTQATDAFTRPLFTRDRMPGPDMAPAVASVSEDPDAPATSDDPTVAPALKGLIIGERGGRVALQAADAPAAVWVKVGEKVGNWTVEAITVRGVRLRNGDNVADIKFSKDN
jgi:hypothetical protein